MNQGQLQNVGEPDHQTRLQLDRLVLKHECQYVRSSLQLRILKSTVDPDKQNQDIVYESVALRGQESLHTAKVAPATNGVSADEKRAFVHHALKVMFQCEYHVLVEYVEAIIPMIYSFHKGTYSVERLQALKKYCNEASPLRVMSVCIALPAPALIVAIINECIPLQSPQDGWKANIGVWIRLFLIAFFSSIALIIQTNEMVPLSKLTRSKTFLVATAASAFYVGMQCVVAGAWVFPIPFGYIMFAPVYSNSLMATFVLAIGISKFRQNPLLGQQLRQQLGIIAVQTGLVCIYPAFSAVYVRLEPLHQTAFVFVLPLIKFAMQSAVVRLASHVEEYIPGIVVFSVEVFNALYLTKCMQSAKSSSTYLAIMLFDVFEMALAFFEMNNQVSNLHRMQTQHNSTSTQNLLDIVLSVCKEPGVLGNKEASFIRMRLVQESRRPSFHEASSECRVGCGDIVRLNQATTRVYSWLGSDRVCDENRAANHHDNA